MKLKKKLNSAPPVCWLLVGVEIDGGDGEAQVELVSEGPGVEVGPVWDGQLLIHSYTSASQGSPLLEKHKNVPVDPHWWPWPHVWHHFFSCTHSFIGQLVIDLHCYGNWPDNGNDEKQEGKKCDSLRADSLLVQRHQGVHLGALRKKIRRLAHFHRLQWLNFIICKCELLKSSLVQIMKTSPSHARLGPLWTKEDK